MPCSATSEELKSQLPIKSLINGIKSLTSRGPSLALAYDWTPLVPGA
jgi:hypothetical protein